MPDVTQQLRSGIVEAVEELAGGRADQIVGVCVFSDSDAMTLGVVMNSAENLAKMRDQPTPDADPVALRWQPDFWDIGPERSTQLNDLITGLRPRLTPEQVRAGDWEPVARFADEFFPQVVQVLVELRTEGFFAEHTPRAILEFKVSDVLGQFPLEVDTVRRLNAPEDAEEFARWAEQYA